MRRIALILFLAGVAVGQNMAEFGAVTAGTTIGAASGKAVSDGIDTIFGKVNQQTVKAAGKETAKPAPVKEAPLLSVAPGVARNANGGVPAPPPATGHFTRTAPSAPMAVNTVSLPFSAATLADALPAQPLPPPPTMTRESLTQVTTGMNRDDLLKLGEPASRITMIEGGHYAETFTYRADRQQFGAVRLQDGTVMQVQAK